MKDAELLLLEDQIRNGALTTVKQKLIAAINSAQVPRRQAATLSAMARRAGALDLSLRILKPIIRTTKDLETPISPLEKGEYAASLLKVGAVTEADRLLAEIDPKDYPRVLLYQSFSLFRQWRYEEAIPLLEQLAKNSDLELYDQAVVSLNLAASFTVANRFLEAANLLEKWEATIQENSWLQLKDLAQELRMQALIGLGKFSEAESIIRSSEVSHPTENHQFILKKRLFFLRCSSKISTILREEFVEFRREAFDFSDWDAMRDCDFYQGVAMQDQRYLSKVFYGSPFLKYRSMVKQALAQSSMVVPEEFNFTHPVENPTTECQIDLWSGKAAGSDLSFPPGLTMHKILCALTHDFYRPVPTGEIFYHLFPTEAFDPESSPNRIYNLLFRFRKSVDQANLGMKVIDRANGFKLFLGDKTSIRIPLGFQSIDLHDREAYLGKLLHRHFGQTLFQTKEAANLLDLTVARTQTFLNALVGTKDVQVLGRGRYTQYQFSNLNINSPPRAVNSR